MARRKASEIDPPFPLSQAEPGETAGPPLEDAPVAPSAVAGKETPKVYQAIRNVMMELAVEGIGKTSRNKDQGYQFRGVEALMNVLSPLLVRHGLLILPRFVEHRSVSRTSQKGGYLNDVFAEAFFDFVSVEDGSVHTIRTFGQGMDSADKATNKSMSAAFKYACFIAFCIPTEGVMDEGDFDHEEPRGERPVRDERLAREERPARREPEPRREREPEHEERPHPAAPAPEKIPAVQLSEIPADEEEQPVPWRVENVWPILTSDVSQAKTAAQLKYAFARAYKWAKQLPMENVSRNLLATLTKEIYEPKKAAMGIS